MNSSVCTSLQGCAGAGLKVLCPQKLVRSITWTRDSASPTSHTDWCSLAGAHVQTCARDQQRPRERPTGIDRHCCYIICFVTKMKPEFHSLLLVRATFGRTAYLDVAKNSRVQRSFWLSAFHNVNTVPMRTSPHAPDERSLPRCRTKARSISTRC